MSNSESQSFVLASKCQHLSSTPGVTRGSLEIVGFQPSKHLTVSSSVRDALPCDREHLLSIHGIYGKKSSLHTHVHAHVCANAHTHTHTHTHHRGLTSHTIHHRKREINTQRQRTESISLTDMNFCQFLP